MPPRIEALEQMAARAPGDPFPQYCLAQAYRSQGRPDDAVRAFDDLRARFPNYVPQYLMAAQLLSELKRFDDARAVLHDGIEAARKARDSHAQGELEGMLASLPA